VSGLEGGTALLQINTGGLPTDVVGSATGTRDLALTGEAGQQFRVKLGATGRLSGIVTLVDDGSGVVDSAATAMSLQEALRALAGDDSVTVEFDADRGVYRIAGLDAPTNALEMDSQGLVSDVTVDSRPGGVVFKVFDVGGDEEIDTVVIKGSSGADDYRVSTIEAIGVDGKGATSLRYQMLNGQVSGSGQLLSHVVVDVFGLETADHIRLDALEGDDRVDATGVLTAVVGDLVLDGGAGDDRLIGSNQRSISDVLIGGAGSDRITGGAGVDRFYEAAIGEAGNLAGDVDTLIEARDADFWLSNTSLRIDDSVLHDQFGNEVEAFDDIFEDVELFGLDGANRFTISGWSDSGVLDGAKGGDTYLLELARTGSGNQFFDIRDTGASGIDSLTYKGSAGDDTIQLDTVYDPAQDEAGAFTDPRWLEYGSHGDGLIIGHFDADASDYGVADLEDEDRLMRVTESALAAGSDFQVVNYATVEEVVVFGGEGDDTFIADDTGARFNVFGNAGDDRFHVGSVLETEDVIVEGQIVTIVRQITRGTSYNDTSFYGGDGDDYFEVNHTAADIKLFGDNGDDVFLVKALLTVDDDGELLELASATSTVSGTFGENSELGTDTSNDTREIDIDTLVYVENANVSIDGGAGFDAVSLVGTVLSDTFYIYVETDEETGERVQRIYGAGVKLQRLLNIEQIQLLTGAGDDTVHLYGVDLGTIGDMVIRTGTGSDTVNVGGPEQIITQIFPRSSSQFFSTVEGYEVPKDAVGRFVRVGEVDGLPFYQVRETSRIVPFEVENPGRSENIVMPASHDLGAFVSPVVIDAGTGLNDEIILNVQAGASRLRFTDGELKKKDLVFDTSKIALVSESGDPASDLPAILLGTAGETGDEARELLAAVATDYIRFTDRYYEPGLLEQLAALTGGQTQDVVVPAGVSYFTIETTLVDDVVVTAREQLLDFAADFGLALEWQEVDHPDPSRAQAGEKLYELLAIRKDGAAIAFEALHTQTVVFTGDERGVVKDLSGLTLKTVAPLRATLSAGAITRSVEMTLTGSVGQEFRLTAGGASSAVIALAADAAGEVDRAATARAMQDALRALTGSDLPSVRAAGGDVYRVTGLAPAFVDLQVDVVGLATDVAGMATEVDPVQPVRVDAVNTLVEDGEDAQLYFFGFDTAGIRLGDAGAAGALHLDNDLFTGRLNVQGGSSADRIVIENVVTDTVVHGGAGDDVITVGHAGLLDDVGAPLHLFGDEGNDEIIVEGSADANGADVSIDKNVLEHTSSFEQLSRVTDALGLKGVTPEENAILEDRLKEAALPYGQAALDVDAADLATYRDYAADALLAELENIVDDLAGQITAEIDEAVNLLVTTDQDLLENQIKLYVRTRYYETINIENEILRHLTNTDGVETYLLYRDYDPQFYFDWVKGPFGIQIPIPKVRWVIDWSDSNKVTRDWGLKDGLEEIEKFFRNPDAHFKTYGLAGVSNDNQSKKYLKDIESILDRNSLFSLVTGSYSASNKLKLLGGGQLDDDEQMSLYLKTSDVNTEFKRANAFAIAKVFDEARAKYSGSSSIYANLLGQRGLDAADLNALYARYQDNTQVRGFDFNETNYSKAEMIVSVGGFDIEIDEQYRVLDASVKAKVDHLNGTYRAAYLDQVAALQSTIEAARAGHDYSAATLEAVRAGVAALKAFFHPLTQGAVDTAAGGEGTLIKAQAYNLFATTTGNGIAGQISRLAALSQTIAATDFGAATAVADSTDFAELSAVFNGDAYQNVRAAYAQASEVISSFTLFNARYLGGAEPPAQAADAAADIRQLDAVAERFAAFDEAVRGGFVFDAFRDAFLDTQREITTFIEVNPDYINDILVESRAGAQSDSLAQDAVDVTEPVAVNRIQYDLFNGALTKAKSDLVTLEKKLQKEYTIVRSFLWFSWTIHLDYSHDARYTQQQSLINALKTRVAAADRFADASDASFVELNANRGAYEAERAAADARVAAKREQYETLKTEINGQFAVLKELGKFAIEVLRETRAGQPVSGFVDTGSLISELRGFTDDYQVLPVDGTYTPVDTQEFLPGDSSNSIILSETHVSYTDVTTVSGMSPFDIHVGYGDVEQLTLVLGDRADTVRVHDTLGGAGARVSVLTRGGDDLIEVGFEGSVDDIQGELLVDAGTGDHNVLVIDDSMDADADAGVLVTGSSVSGLAPGLIHYAATGGAYGSHFDPATGQFSAGIEILAGTGNDTITALGSRSTPGLVEVTRIDAGAGDDDVTIADADARYLEVHGGTGMDDLVVSGGAAFGGVTVFGGDDDDFIVGGPAADVLVGGLGADTVQGGDGDDVVVGDNALIVRDAGYVVQRIGTTDDGLGGNDILSSSEGNDVIIGGAGSDQVTALFGGSILLGDAGVVVFADGSTDEWDVFTTTPGAGGNDTLIGGPETNILIGGFGMDTILGGDGDDVILGDGGRVDRALVAGALVTQRARTIGDGEGDVDTITGGDGRDVILGGAAGDVITASLGGDIILGDAGEADLLGDVFTTSATVGGNDRITGGAGAGAANRSIIIGGAGADILAGGDGDNVLLGDGGYVTRADGVVKQVRSIDPETGGIDTITSGDGSDIILGGAEGDFITVGLGSDIVLGDNGEVNLNNTAPGESNDIRTISEDVGGDDEITGGEGSSILIGGFGADSIVTGAGSTVILGDNGEILRDASEAVLRARTTDTDPATGGADEITTQGGENVIFGGLGSDLIDAPLGSNIVLGDNGEVNVGGDIFTTETDLGGDDVITGGADNIILGGFGEDTITLGAGTNTVLGDNGIVRRTGGAVTQVKTTDLDSSTGGVDSIVSNGGENIILGGVGNDLIDAPLGSNIVLGDNGEVNVGGDVFTTEIDLGGDDVITGGADNIILGGFGEDEIALGGGANIVLGDNGIVRRSGGVVTQVNTTDLDFLTGRADRITSLGGVNIVLGGVGGDLIDAAFGSNIVLGDNGQVNVGGDVFTTEIGLGGNDIITGGADNIILGGFGDDEITLGGGTNIVLGDNGIVRRVGGAVTQVKTTDLDSSTGGVDLITSNGGVNVILGGVGGDLIDAPFGTNIVLGDNGEVNVGGDVFTTEIDLGGDDIITGGADNIILGGFGEDTITLGGGTNTVLGDNGYVQRNAAGLVLQVRTTDEEEATGGADVITSLGGTNVILGGVGADRIAAPAGTNIILGDNGVVNLNDPVANDVYTTDHHLGGADLITGGTGDNIILGGAEGDTITGGDGVDVVLGDNGRVYRDGAHVVTRVETADPLVGGADTISGGGNDDILLGGADADWISGGSGADIVVGDNGAVDLSVAPPLVVSENPFDGGSEIGGADEIHGNAGDDTLYGGGGDDEMYGELGNDTLHGQGGNDVLLGDTGEVTGRSVLLTDVATLAGWLALNGPQAPGAEQAVVDGLPEADLVLLAGRYAADGSTDSRALLLELLADGDDTLYGGEGDDALFGQRGNDSLYGDDGEDLLSGGAGDDVLHGGEGDDTLVGDDVHLDSAAAVFPNVTHGLLIDGATVVPMVSVEPGRDTNAVASVLAHVFGYQDAIPAQNSLALADGSVLVPFASVVTDFAHHLGQLRGNDELRGEGGDDTLVGDDQMVYARAVTFDEESMARAEAITRALLDVSDDFSDLVHRQYDLLDDHHERYDDHRTVVDNVFTVGSDLLDGGEGNDVLIGDDNLLIQPSFTLPVGLAGDFERFAESVTDSGHELAHAVFDLGDIAHHQREEVVQVPHKQHFHEELEHHVDIVEMGNDTLFGGAGNDQIIGDAFIVRMADATLVEGGSTWNFGKDDDWQDNDWKDKYGLDDLGWKHHHHHDDDADDDDHWSSSNIKVGADVISGGDGADLIWGDNLALITSTVTRGAGLGWKDFDKTKDEVEDGLEALVELTDSATYWLASPHHHHQHHDDGHWHHDGKHVRFDNGDDISGGEGDDILFGQDGDDTLRGDAGNDRLVGGDGKDKLDGGKGWDRTDSGSASSSDRKAVEERMVDWEDSFRNYGLTYAPFGGLTLDKGGHPNLEGFEFLSYDRPKHGHHDKDDD
jgi:Ca2+-binding RTX toxin-like protein